MKKPLELLKKKLNNILFPAFSELELIALFYLITLLIIEQKSEVLNYFIGVLSDNLIAGIFLIIIVITFYIELAVIALKNKIISVQDKINFSFFFYFSLSLISLFSSYDLINNFFSLEKWRIVESIFVLFILLRSFFALLIIIFVEKTKRHSFYLNKITDEQLDKREIVLVVFLSTVFYIILRDSHTISSTIILSYFYIITATLFFRKLIN